METSISIRLTAYCANAGSSQHGPLILIRSVQRANGMECKQVKDTISQ